ncbi:MAG: thermonuclease family protein [Coriobacteriia bacterium]|nr:thermonuclease family protein [Coriobacteriia bacterium]
MRTRLHFTLALLLAAVLAAGCTLLPESAEEPPPGAPEVTQADVIRHTDGDTAHFRLDGGAEEKVRFIGIDTPEVGENLEPFGEEAAVYTAEAIPVGTTVWLETDAELRDKHGRLLAYVWLERPTVGDAAEVREKMLNARLVLDGYANAYTYPPNVKYTNVLKDLQSEARGAKRGLWAE